MAKPDEHTVFGFLGGIQTSYTLMYTDYADIYRLSRQMENYWGQHGARGREEGGQEEINRKKESR